MKKLMLTIAGAVVIGFSACAANEQWFNGGIDSAWPNSPAMNGGKWDETTTGQAEWNAEENVLDFSATNAVVFYPDDAKTLGTDVKLVKYMASIDFAPFSSMAEVSTDAKAGVAVVTNADEFAFYVLAKDPDASTNVWVSTEIQPNASMTNAVAITVTNIDSGVGMAIYELNGGTVEKVVAIDDNSFTQAAFTGDGSIASLKGEYATREVTFSFDCPEHVTVHSVSNLAGVIEEPYKAPYDSTIWVTYKTDDGKLFENGSNLYTVELQATEGTYGAELCDAEVKDAPVWIKGGAFYLTLKDALGGAEDGDEIQLVQNVTNANVSIAATTFPTDGLVLNLMGKTLTFYADGTKDVDAISVSRSNTLAIVNGTIDTLASEPGQVRLRDIIRLYGNTDNNDTLALTNVVFDCSNMTTGTTTKAFAVISGEGGDIDIQGGSFTVPAVAAANTNAFYAIKFGNHAQAQYATGTLVLNGTVNGDILLTGGTYVEGENAVVNGNYFYGKNVYTSWEDENNTVFAARTGVLPEKGAEDNFVGQLYKALPDAVAAAEDGETVTVLDDLALDATLTLDKAITLDLGGKEVTLSDATMGIVINADATVQNGSFKSSLTANARKFAVYVNPGKSPILKDLTIDAAYYEYGLTCDSQDFDPLSAAYETDPTSTVVCTNVDVTGNGSLIYAQWCNVTLDENCSAIRDENLPLFTDVAHQTAVYAVLNATVTIAGGEYTHVNAIQTGSLGATIVVNGGDYSGDVTSFMGWMGQNKFATNIGTFTLNYGVYNGAIVFKNPNAGRDQEVITKGADVEITAPEGYAWDANGVLTKGVAGIDGHEEVYATLQEAVNNVSPGETVLLLADITSAETLTVNLGDDEIWIDFNNHKYEYTGTGWAIRCGDTASGGVYFENGTIESAGMGIRVNAYNVTIENTTVNAADRAAQTTLTCSFTLDSGSILKTANDEPTFFINTKNDASPDEKSTIVIEGQVLNTYDASGADCSCFAICATGTDTVGSDITIAFGAEVSTYGDAPAIYFPSAGTLTVNGGTITGSEGIYVKSGTVTINDGDIYGEGTSSAYAYQGSGTSELGDAFVVDNCGYPAGAPVVTIRGGTFTSTYGKAVGSYANTGCTALDKFISGGTFSTDPTALLAADYVAEEDEYNNWVVREAVAITEVTLDVAEATLKVGATTNLVVTVEPEDADVTNTVWTSSDVAVATVADGTVTAIAAGSATITVTKYAAGGSSASATCEITVETAVTPVKPGDEKQYDSEEEAKAATNNFVVAAATPAVADQFADDEEGFKAYQALFQPSITQSGEKYVVTAEFTPAASNDLQTAVNTATTAIEIGEVSAEEGASDISVSTTVKGLYYQMNTSDEVTGFTPVKEVLGTGSAITFEGVAKPDTAKGFYKVSVSAAPVLSNKE